MGLTVVGTRFHKSVQISAGRIFYFFLHYFSSLTTVLPSLVCRVIFAYSVTMSDFEKCNLHNAKSS